MSSPVIVTLTPEQAEHLQALASHCGISIEQMAQVFVADGIASYKSQQDELKGTLVES
jgi:hypothetical protein